MVNQLLCIRVDFETELSLSVNYALKKRGNLPKGFLLCQPRVKKLIGGRKPLPLNRIESLDVEESRVRQPDESLDRKSVV